jgi:hypothetical protein
MVLYARDPKQPVAKRRFEMKHGEIKRKETQGQNEDDGGNV